MLHPLINRSSDLRQLFEEGYEIEIRGSYLVMTGVPYVNAERQVRLGTLISILTLAGDVTSVPNDHVIYFSGEYPCNRFGQPLEQIRHQSSNQTFAPELVVNHSFSSKPPEGYRDYHHKMTSYASILLSQALAIDENATAQTFRVTESEDLDSPFVYIDSASSRAGISSVTAKLRLRRVAIFGLGGSGAYILDLLAKTPVAEIALFDGDTFLQHNAFRAPGAATLDQLRERLKKVDYYARLYSAMHKNIVANPHFINSANVTEVGELDFAFISMDAGSAKRALVEYLEHRDVPFIDVGLGVEMVDDSLLGVVRVTTNTQAKRDTFGSRVSFADTGRDDLYSKNIQIADLNALNAALAIIRFKKHFGFYTDFEHEHFSAYSIDGNHMLNEDKA